MTYARRQGLTVGTWLIIPKPTVCPPLGCLARGLHLLGPLAQPRLVQVQSRKATYLNFRIPHVNLSPPPPSTDKEEYEDWKRSLDEFQEWLGLACMGSQRQVAWTSGFECNVSAKS